ncbi:diacylglycerol kinase family protein [Massilia sp. CCM 9210]|uniref:diacylglycerol kinase family protein n=1 Tax=Massilia scottii TaxID=3057166 RepID=UPI00279642D2|nr:diacylglycerol kinase family protein [Massilia sp. CCM 9210]MDQ1811789.1 diacylglycerol kinase family protein [Massilia sp. CCM 9210]
MNETKNVGTPEPFSLAARSKSFGYAIAGIVFMLKTQHNAWLHLIATMIVAGLAFYFKVSAADWRWLVVAMVAVWVAETINTAVEYVCDVVSPGYAIAVKHAKDIAAGGVLIAAVGAVLIGALTFWPYVMRAL